MRARSSSVQAKPALVAAAVLLLFASSCFAAAPGLDAYRNDNYTEAYQQFEKTLQEHPETHAADKIEFDAGTAAYKMGDFNKALEWFSRSLLSKDKSLQEKSHYNIGRTLEERADKATTNEKALGELYNAQSHYEEALKLDPNDDRAKANLEEAKEKIERLKQKPKPSPTPTPTPPPPPQNNKKQNQQNKDQQKDQQQKNDQDQQQQSNGNDQQQQQKQQAKNDKKPQPSPNESPSPSPGEDQQKEPGSSPSPSPDKGSNDDKNQKKQQPGNGEQDASPSPSASDESSATPSPSPGSGEEPQPQGSPSASPGSSPGKPLSGKVEAAGDEKPKEPAQAAQAAEAEPEKEGEMSEKQAQMLLQSMKDEEQRVQLDERKAAQHVYKDW
jgi:Ca-activated chloride channel family protein